MQLKPYKTGPWGSDTEGKPFDIKETPLRLVDSITIRRAAVIDCIEFSYIDQAGQKHYAKMGGDGGSPTTVSVLTIHQEVAPIDDVTYMHERNARVCRPYGSQQYHYKKPLINLCLHADHARPK
jgi:hypothetical protein